MAGLGRMRDNEIFLCFDCGTKNRIRPGVRGVARCGNCGAKLLAPEGPKGGNKPASVDDPRTTKEGGQDATRPFPNWLVLVGISAAIFLLPYYLGPRDSQLAAGSSAGPSAPSPAAQNAYAPDIDDAFAPGNHDPYALGKGSAFTAGNGDANAHGNGDPYAPEEAQPVVLPVHQNPGIIFNNTGRRLLAPFEILTKPGQDYYIKLVELPRDLDAVGIYVSGGKRVDILVPLGSYELRYAVGKTWYGIDNLFGPETVRIKAVDRFDFTKDRGGYSGFTVELILQVGGNLRTTEIGPDEF
jgi:hypothetical protein